MKFLSSAAEFRKHGGSDTAVQEKAIAKEKRKSAHRKENSSKGPQLTQNSKFWEFSYSDWPDTTCMDTVRRP